MQGLRSSNAVRAVAATISLLVLIASLFVLYKPRLSSTTRRFNAVPVWVVVRPPVRAQETPPSRSSAQRATGRFVAQRHRTAQATVPIAEPPTVPESTHVERRAPVQATGPASSPLDLGDSVIRAAVAGSKGAVRKLAEASGQPLDTPRPTKGDVLAAAMADAGVPDCLKPDALRHDPPHIGPVVLGGLLSLPFLAHAALTGKCKP